MLFKFCLGAFGGASDLSEYQNVSLLCKLEKYLLIMEIIRFGKITFKDLIPLGTGGRHYNQLTQSIESTKARRTCIKRGCTWKI